MDDGSKPYFTMSSQSPAFRRTVALRMEAYKQRTAQRIKREMDQRAEGPMDLAYALGVSQRTVERWLEADTEPQRANWRAMAEHWGKQVKEIRPDLATEEQALQAQLNRIEEKLERLLELAGEPTEAAPRPAGETLQRPRAAKPKRPSRAGRESGRAGSQRKRV